MKKLPYIIRLRHDDRSTATITTSHPNLFRSISLYNLKEGRLVDDPMEEVSREQKLQAVLLLDTDSNAFLPVTRDVPFALIPLGNHLLIDHILEFLECNEVQEVLIFSKSSESIESYVAASAEKSKLAVKLFNSQRSEGDIIRNIFRDRLIQSDPFILISGGIVANIDLKEVLLFHKMKAKADPEAMLTVALKKSSPLSGTIKIVDDLLVALDFNSQLVLYDIEATKETFSLPAQVLQDHPLLTIQTNVCDSNVYICSSEVLGQFEDNFDYEVCFVPPKFNEEFADK